MKRRSLVVLALTMTFGGLAAAQEPRFTFERSAQTQASGRPAPARRGRHAPFRGITISGDPARRDRMVAEGGLNDLRLFDASGRPVPYLLVQPRQEPGWRRPGSCPRSVRRPRPRAASRWTSGHASTIDRVRVAGISGPFLKRLTSRAAATARIGRCSRAKGHSSICRTSGSRTRICPLNPARTRCVRVLWNDANSGRVPLPARVFARAASGLPPISETSADVPFERRPSEPGRSRYRVQLPGARLPIVALGPRRCPRPRVSCRVRVSSPASPAPRLRLSLSAAARSCACFDADASAESLRVTIAPPAEAELDLIVEDGNNPPLDLRKASVVFAELPWIYFEASSPAIVARYGDPAAAAPTHAISRPRGRQSISRAHLRVDGTLRARWPAASARSGPAPAISAGATLEGEFRLFEDDCRRGPSRAGGAPARCRSSGSQPGAHIALRRRSDRGRSEQAGPVSARATRRAACRRPDARPGLVSRCRRFRRRTGAVGRCIALRFPNAACRRGR